MNDDELLTGVREQRGKVPMTVPVEQVISRGRAVRARRRIPGVAGALAAAAGAALAVTALLPSAHQPAAQPAGWTVARQADGNIRVTIRELRDPAGLQRTLRADGVPASVTFIGHQNPACQHYPGKGGSSPWPILLLPGRAEVRVVVIHPAFFSALPARAGVLIAAGHHHQTLAKGSREVIVGLVKASPQCTGS